MKTLHITFHEVTCGGVLTDSEMLPSSRLGSLQPFWEEMGEGLTAGLWRIILITFIGVGGHAFDWGTLSFLFFLEKCQNYI